MLEQFITNPYWRALAVFLIIFIAIKIFIYVLVKVIPKLTSKTTLVYAFVVLIVVGAGIWTGKLLSGGTSGLTDKGEGKVPGAQGGQNEAGLADESTFRDSAEGLLVSGGIKGEGTHHLEREGGEDQFVYLTSTVIDLESFSGKKVMVWGETISARSAGWLMDVGKVKVLE